MAKLGRGGGLLRFLIFVLVLSLVATLFWGAGRYFSKPVDTGPVTPSRAPVTVVLDAGHGGEDGGTVGGSGVCEKDLNLALALTLRDLLTANGVKVVMTREDDRLLYDPNADYHGRKKALDLAERRRIAEATPNAVFISIHMNAYPDPQYRGLQVWYSKNHPDSEQLAASLQRRIRETLQPDNDRDVKPATSSIYLLHHLRIPAVLIECGFLSNPEECELLASESYRRQLAMELFLAITDAPLLCGITPTAA